MSDIELTVDSSLFDGRAEEIAERYCESLREDILHFYPYAEVVVRLGPKNRCRVRGIDDSDVYEVLNDVVYDAQLDYECDDEATDEN